MEKWDGRVGVLDRESLLRRKMAEAAATEVQKERGDARDDQPTMWRANDEKEKKAVPEDQEEQG